MVQTNFTVGNAGSLATVLADIGGGADAAIDTGYTITMTAGVLLTAGVTLQTGSSVTLEGSYPFIMPAFAVTGTVVTDLNFTGTVTLDNGVLINSALSLNTDGTVTAGLFTGSVLGTTGDAGDSAINSGTIQSNGTYAGVQFAIGTVQNGWNGSSSALISGVPEGVYIQVSGLVQNGGTIIGSGATSIAVSLGQGTIDNGQIGDTGALLSAGGHGVDISGAGVVNNDGTISGGLYDGIVLGSGSITNGQIGVDSALIEGGPKGNGVWIWTGPGNVTNYGSIIGGGYGGVYLEYGGTVTNGGLADPAALVSGAAEGVLLLGPGVLLNDGTVLAGGSDAGGSVIGAFFDAGGTIQNLTATALIGGREWGAVVENGAGFVDNLGTIQAVAASGLGVDFTAGGTVVNATAATISGPYDGVRISAGAPGAGAVVVNDGTIEGSVAVDFQSGVASAGTLTNDGLVEGTSGDAVVFGTGAERLVLQSAGVFMGTVAGSNASGSSTTLELAGGTQGTLSGLASNGGTVTDSAGSFVFSAFGTIALDDGASWTITAPGTLNTLENAGALDVSGGAVAVTGSLTNSGSLSIAGGTLTATTGAVADQGIIAIGAGGTLATSSAPAVGSSSIVIGNGNGPGATVTVSGEGADLSSDGRLGVGSAGEASLIISQGGFVAARESTGSGEAMYIGAAGATGAVIVTDPDSLLSTYGQIDVGLGGNGSLLIENRASVFAGQEFAINDPTQGFDVGTDSTASGNAAVTGPQSLLSNTGRFVVGDAGLGSLSIQSGGTVITSPGTVAGLAAAVIAAQASAAGSSVNVAGAGSNWQVGGALDVGNAATGLLAIDAGATVTAATLDAGLDTNAAGIVTVSGNNADLTIAGSLAVGDAGAGELSVLNGANLNIGGDLDIGTTAGGSGNADFADTTGTITIGNNLNVGGFGVPAVLTIGTDTAVYFDNGNEVIGAGGDVILGTPFDPPAALIVASGGGQTFPTGLNSYAEDISNSGVLTIPAAADVIIDTPYIQQDNKGTNGVWTMGSNAALVLNADTVTGQSFGIGSGGTLVIGYDQLATIKVQSGGSVVSEANPNLGDALIGNFLGTIDSFAAGQTIDVGTYGTATFSQSGSIISVLQNGGTLGVLTFDTVASATAAENGGAVDVPQTLCFLAGTLIRTRTGDVPVEKLAVGDDVLTASGHIRPIRWVGQGKVLATRGRRNAATPVIVRKGALAPNVPHADLRVTKGHSLHLDGVLIPVEFLVNHRSILWDDRAQEVSVYHVELATHDVLLANGAPAESFRNDGNRWLFQNAYSGWDLPAQAPCAPVLTGGPVVDAVWRRLLERAGPRPAVPLTDDPDFHLVVDGLRVEAAGRGDAAPAAMGGQTAGGQATGGRAGDVLVFALAGGASGVRLVSRAAVPQELGVSRDPRCLGVAVRRIVVRQGTRFRVLRADDPALAEGFHAFETETGLRWTDGDAVLPRRLFAGFAGPCEVMVHLAGTARYIDDGAMASVA